MTLHPRPNQLLQPTSSNRTQSSGTSANLTPAEQSHLDLEANYVEAADKVDTKMATEAEKMKVGW